jgi:hypothetical protein
MKQRSYSCKCFNRGRETKESVLEFANKDYAMEKLKKQQKINEELARQIEEKEKAILREREEKIETRKKIDDSLQHFKEQYEMELKQKRIEEIKEAQHEIQKTLAQNELKKSQELFLKEREKKELVRNYNELKRESDMNETRRVDQLKELANDLRRQIQDRIQENEREKEWEKKQYQLMKQNEVRAINLCPHGKRYICAKCKRAYSRLYLNKRPLQT